MWETEKRDITDLGIEVITPIRSRNDLIGMIMLTNKKNNTAYLLDDLDLLTYLGTSSATVYALTAAIDAKDHYTFGHSQRVADYIVILANAVGLDKSHLEIVREAALLHDIGKIGIPENILTKDGKLTNEEYSIVKAHVEMSITIIKHLPSLNHVISAVISGIMKDGMDKAIHGV